MVFLLMYAALVWWFAAKHRRRWPAFVVPIASVAPVFLLAQMDVVFVIGRESSQATPVYVVAGAMMALIVGGGVFLATMPRTRRDDFSCRACLYDLRGIPMCLCPECGLDLIAHPPKATAKRVRMPKREKVSIETPRRSIGVQLARARDAKRRSTNQRARTSAAPSAAHASAGAQKLVGA